MRKCTAGDEDGSVGFVMCVLRACGKVEERFDCCCLQIGELGNEKWCWRTRFCFRVHSQPHRRPGATLEPHARAGSGAPHEGVGKSAVCPDSTLNKAGCVKDLVSCSIKL